MAHAQAVHVGGGVAIAHLLPLQQKSISDPQSHADRSSPLSVVMILVRVVRICLPRRTRSQLAALYLTSCLARQPLRASSVWSGCTVTVDTSVATTSTTPPLAKWSTLLLEWVWSTMLPRASRGSIWATLTTLSGENLPSEISDNIIFSKYCRDLG